MESELFLSILSSMAEGESASISENNKWSIKKRFLDGTYKLGYVPYGYRWKDGEILVNPEQAEIVKRIFRELLSGKGTEAIAKELNQEQVPTKKSGRWTSTSIRDIIRNEKYTGDCIFQKTYTDSNFNRHKNDGHLDQYYVPDHHEAIISHEDFEAAAALIEQRASEKGIKKGNAKYQQRYAFSSKIICSECGNTFRRRIHSSTYGKYAAWVCNTHLEDTSRCSMLYIREALSKIPLMGSTKDYRSFRKSFSKRPITKRPMMRLPTRSSNFGNGKKNAQLIPPPETHRLSASMNYRILSSNSPHIWKPSMKHW